MNDPMPAVYDELNWPSKLRPPVVLPDVPGFYLTAYEPPDVFRLLEDGTWSIGGWGVPDERVRHDGGSSLTHLRPVAEVAAEVLAEVAAEFGVGFLSGFKAMSARWAAK